MLIALMVMSCGKKNSNIDVDGRYEIEETSCQTANTEPVRLRVMQFTVVNDSSVDVYFESTSASASFKPVSSTGKYSRKDKVFYIDVLFQNQAASSIMMNTQAQQWQTNAASDSCEIIIDASFTKDKSNEEFQGTWTQVCPAGSTDAGASIVCNIVGYKVN